MIRIGLAGEGRRGSGRAHRPAAQGKAGQRFSIQSIAFAKSWPRGSSGRRSRSLPSAAHRQEGLGRLPARQRQHLRDGRPRPCAWIGGPSPPQTMMPSLLHQSLGHDPGRSERVHSLQRGSETPALSSYFFEAVARPFWTADGLSGGYRETIPAWRFRNFLWQEGLWPFVLQSSLLSL